MSTNRCSTIVRNLKAHMSRLFIWQNETTGKQTDGRADHRFVSSWDLIGIYELMRGILWIHPDLVNKLCGSFCSISLQGDRRQWGMIPLSALSSGT